MLCSSYLDHRCGGRILTVRSVYPPVIGPVLACSGRVTLPHLLMRVYQITSREMDLFELLKLALFGFSALASAGPYCASADDEIARGKYIVENVAKCTECHSERRKCKRSLAQWSKACVRADHAECLMGGIGTQYSWNRGLQ